ncbi:hypothetical protein DUNSADRAFT_5859 [Dunaliella salina]|uniref:Uncharacterized protein n=1 Tax=Dunaliella salina TaxID=3046 RepID=A0ABQ7GPE0_DUNSA|nr:hypothetical protein DUNSADRAFT_5859 [Dunaliella salina]|eukprot:KAF5836473.1 hypothetical protein DUNSADRAFT_5859 [Dunaliella salina]
MVWGCTEASSSHGSIKASLFSTALGSVKSGELVDAAACCSILSSCPSICLNAHSKCAPLQKDTLWGEYRLTTDGNRWTDP